MMHATVQLGEKVMGHSFRHLESLGLFPSETKMSSTIVCKSCRTRF